MNRKLRRLMAAFGLLALSATVTAVLALEAAPVDNRSPASAPAFEPALASGNMAMSADEMQVIAERPVFSPGRRPLQRPIVPSTPLAQPGLVHPPVPPTGSLVAVMITPDQRTAVLRLADGKSRTIHEGVVLDGWTVREVKPEQVIFQTGGLTSELGFSSHHSATGPALSSVIKPTVPTIQRRR